MLRFVQFSMARTIWILIKVAYIPPSLSRPSAPAGLPYLRSPTRCRVLSEKTST
jgi:hypothetical protein